MKPRARFGTEALRLGLPAYRVGEIAYDAGHLFERFTRLRQSRPAGDGIPGLHDPIIEHQHAPLDRVDADVGRAAKQEAKDPVIVAQIPTQLVEQEEASRLVLQPLLDHRESQAGTDSVSLIK